MSKIVYLFIIFFCIMLTSCRKSSRNISARSQSQQERVEERDEESGRRNDNRKRRRKRPENKDMNGQDKLVPDNSVTDNDDDINITPHSTDRRITFWSTNGADNIQMLKESCDYNVPKTKGFANKLAGRANFSDGTFNIEQLCEIFAHCYSKWRYVNDPKGCEYLAKASETIASSLTGDCDDFAILVASCMLAIGGDVCIITAHGPNGGHAYAEVDISHMNSLHVRDYIKRRFNSHKISRIVYREDGNHKWLNLDWSGDYPGGPLYEAYSRNIYTCINGIWSYSE